MYWMPLYEYEPVDRECLMCPGRVQVLQALDDEALEYCPYCGLSVRRVISAPNVQVSRRVDPDKAARKGFSTFRKAGKGRWEKIAGPDTEGPPTGGPESPEGEIKL